MKKRILALLLCTVILILSLSSCAGSSKVMDEAKEKVTVFLDSMIADDRDTMYALLYPGTIDRAGFETVTDQMQEYCPLVEGYALKITGFQTGFRAGTANARYAQIVYSLTFADLEYVLSTEYVKDATGTGFSIFNITTRAEYDAAVEASK